MEWRLFYRGSRASVCPPYPGSGIWLSGRERLVAKRKRTLAPLLDATHHNAVRRSTRVFGRGSIEFLCPANHRILAYVRRLGNEAVLVVNNLSSTAQAVELDLRHYKGNIPIEMFGKNMFPRVGDLPYLLTMGPYQFYWFRLRRI